MSAMAVVLAAGAGTRFGGPVHKLRAELAGRPLVSHVLDTVAGLDARDGIDERAVVVGAEPLDDLVDAARFTVLDNPRHAEGQSTSLAVAVDHATARGHDAIVVGLADQPFVDAADWRAVAATPGAIVAASFDGRRRPPVKLDASVWPLLARTGDEGARALMRGRPELVTDVVCGSNPIDIDTPEDLEQWN